jgi:hypothetical protein
MEETVSEARNSADEVSAFADAKKYLAKIHGQAGLRISAIESAWSLFIDKIRDAALSSRTSFPNSKRSRPAF